MEKIKVGVIGCGGIGCGAHIPCYAANDAVEIKYFCDIIPERAQNAAEKYGGIAVTDYHQVINDPDVVAVSVCTPNNTHPTIAIDAMRAGKHVLCEKPAAKTLEEALLMQKVQQETGVNLVIGVVNRYNGAVNEIKKMIAAGDLGDVYHVYVSFRAHRSIPGLGGLYTNKEVAGGGVLIDWGVHYFDLALYCLGEPEPRSVSGHAHSVLGCDMPNYVYDGMWAEHSKDLNGVYDVEDFVTGFIRTDGPTISFNGCWAQNIQREERYIDFLGDKGGIHLNYCGNFTYYTVEDKKFVNCIPEYNEKDMYQEEIDSFIRSIETGEKLQSHIDYIIKTAKIMQGIYDSSDCGKEIFFD